jgi:protein-tyrosine phosphatase
MTLPIDDSYWLIEGQLMAGEYPGAPTDEEARPKLAGLLDLGIRSFIDLTETTDPLTPYEDLLREIASEKGIDVVYRRMPIRDMSIPTKERMTEILERIDSEIAAGRPVYFHCWGGIGRTGTVSGCWLVGQGHACDDALALIKKLREHTPDHFKSSPQTDDQVEFVRRWDGEAAARRQADVPGRGRRDE